MTDHRSYFKAQGMTAPEIERAVAAQNLQALETPVEALRAMTGERVPEVSRAAEISDNHCNPSADYLLAQICGLSAQIFALDARIDGLELDLHHHLKD